MGLRWVAVLACLLWASVAHAQITVTNNNDAGPSSLRAGIINANGLGGNVTITITAQGMIALQSALPALTANATITGPGAGRLTVQGSATAAPVFTTNGTVQLSALTIAGGMHAGNNGGGIAVTGGSLVVDSVVITGNAAVSGSAIHSAGPLTIRRTTISSNLGTGAIYAAGDTTIVDSTIADNDGTAIVFPTAGTTLTINRATISGNEDLSGIGGLHLQGGTANIRNSTFSGNTGRQGGDFWTSSDGVTLSLLNVTATGGSEPSLLFDHTATVTLRNTVFAGTGARCSSPNHPTSQGNNLSSDTTCNFTGSGDREGGDARLGPLADNGGATRTHLPLAGSPVLNAGNGASLDPTDQRGKMRVQFNAVDIGAVEAVEPIIATQPVAPPALIEGDMFTLSVVAMNQESTAALAFQWRKDGSPVTGATSATFTKAAAPADSGMWDVIVTNEGGGLASSSVAVMVTAVVRPDGPPDDGGGDGGGCCSSTGAASNAALALALLGLLGIPRRRR
jgi:MYXO-CTERM domain-containing protein